MTTHSPVPADVEPTSLADLVEDCREVSGVLAPWFTGAVRLPIPRDAARVSVATDLLAAGARIDLDGYADYGC